MSPNMDKCPCLSGFKLRGLGNPSNLKILNPETLRPQSPKTLNCSRYLDCCVETLEEYGGPRLDKEAPRKLRRSSGRS